LLSLPQLIFLFLLDEGPPLVDVSRKLEQQRRELHIIVVTSPTAHGIGNPTEKEIF
jgi:hypothetical protein